jgi:hypothetical protein
MAVSNWFLYIGVFLCATGFGVVVGAIFIFYWGIKKLEEAKQGNSYTEINYSASIGHYHADNGGKPGADDNVSREYISKETLEENR